jgi:hypothetical protein
MRTSIKKAIGTTVQDMLDSGLKSSFTNKELKSLGIKMQASLPLNKMPMTEKPVADDPMRNPDDIPSPEWHNEVLSARAERVKNGEAQFKDFESAKSKLRSEFE